MFTDERGTATDTTTIGRRQQRSSPGAIARVPSRRDRGAGREGTGRHEGVAWASRGAWPGAVAFPPPFLSPRQWAGPGTPAARLRRSGRVHCIPCGGSSGPGCCLPVRFGERGRSRDSARGSEAGAALQQPWWVIGRGEPLCGGGSPLPRPPPLRPGGGWCVPQRAPCSRGSAALRGEGDGRDPGPGGFSAVSAGE